MKKISVFGLFFLLTLFSCSSEYTILESIESISLTADSSYKLIGEEITFTVKTNNGTDVTEDAEIFVNDEKIEGNTFTSETIANYTIKAVYFGVSSEPFVVTFSDGSEINFKKRVLIEDYTGTWCGNCPRVAHAIELAKQQSDAIVTVAIHRSSSNPSDPNYDPYNYDSSTLESLINISGYPKALLNRMTRWSPLEQNNIPQVINLTQGENPKLGLAMNAQVNGGNINLEVKTKFSKDFSNLKLVVCVLENGLIYDQVNYTNFYTGPGYILNFQHDHTLRTCLTPLLGEAVANNLTSVGQTYTKTFSVPVPANVANANNIEFVAFMVDENNKVINVRKATPGQNQEFEQL